MPNSREVFGQKTECIPVTVALIYHLSASLRRCFFSLLSYSATRLREYILCCIRRTAILKNNNTAEKRREKEAFALASIAHYCFVEIRSNCAWGRRTGDWPWFGRHSLLLPLGLSCRVPGKSCCQQTCRCSWMQAPAALNSSRPSHFESSELQKKTFQR